MFTHGTMSVQETMWYKTSRTSKWLRHDSCGPLRNRYTTQASSL